MKISAISYDDSKLYTSIADATSSRENRAEDVADSDFATILAQNQNAFAIDEAIAQAKASGQSGLSVYSSKAKALGIVPIHSYANDSATRVYTSQSRYATGTNNATTSTTTANASVNSAYSAELAALCDKYAAFTRDQVAYAGDSAFLYDGTLACSDELNTYFDEAAKTYNVDVKLLKAVAKAESGFRPEAVSSAGAIGVMQLMPQTAEGLGVSDPTDARENIMGGAKYLAQLLDKYNGDATLALASYNAGGSKVDQYNGIPPYTETRNYVVRVLNYYEK